MNEIITIGRQFGSGGRELARRLAEELGYEYYDKQILTEIVNKTQLSEQYVKEIVEHKTHTLFPISIGRSLDAGSDFQLQQMKNIIGAQTDTIKQMAMESSCIIVGRCADYILKQYADEGKIRLMRIFVYADMDSRVKRCMEKAPDGENISEKEMIKEIKRMDKDRANYYADYTLQKWGDIDNYDLCVNTSNMDIKGMAPILSKLFNCF